MLWSDLRCVSIAIFNVHKISKFHFCDRGTPSRAQGSALTRNAVERGDLGCSLLWCEALSSRSRAFRGFPLYFGNLPQNPPQIDTFEHHVLHDGVLEHRIPLLGMSSNYPGKFSL